MNGQPIFDPVTGEILEAGGDSPPAVQAMSLEEARARLVQAHGMVVNPDDPLLMLVTLHQGFVGDYEAMLRRHDDAIRGFLGATGEACAASVDAVLASLKDKTVKASLDHAFALVERQALVMDQLRRMLRRHTVVHSIFTAVSIVGGVLGMIVLRSIIR